MEKVTSEDGTTIAYERFGDGDPLIVVAGAMVDRVRARGISERLGEDFATINYDRRGRGDSGDAGAYAVELFLGTTGMPAEMIKGFRSEPSVPPDVLDPVLVDFFHQDGS